MIRLLIALSVIVSAFGCGDKESNEARLFLDRYRQLEHPDFAHRIERVAGLQRMQFESESVRRVQEACVNMHESALEAERKSAEARASLEALEHRPPEERGPDAQAVVGRLLEESGAAVDRAAELRPQCDELLAELRTRFQPSEGP